jgi:hypothetical protein
MYKINEERIRKDDDDNNNGEQHVPGIDHHQLHGLDTPSLSNSCSFRGVGSFIEHASWEMKAEDARPLLPKGMYSSM